MVPPITPAATAPPPQFQQRCQYCACAGAAETKDAMPSAPAATRDVAKLFMTFLNVPLRRPSVRDAPRRNSLPMRRRRMTHILAGFRSAARIAARDRCLAQGIRAIGLNSG
jgi:hypothetical protein